VRPNIFASVSTSSTSVDRLAVFIEIRAFFVKECETSVPAKYASSETPE